MSQQCPLCRKEVSSNPQFPYYICSACTEKITDRTGNKVVYQFDKSPKGFKAFFRDDPKKEYIYDICYAEGEELKIYSGGKNDLVIQPVNFQKFASRPNDPVARVNEKSTIPYDPEKRRIRKIQLKIEKIIIPAGFVSLFSMIPIAVGCFFHDSFKNGGAKFYLLYAILGFCCAYFSWRIIQTRVRKFSHASYFKQHSYAFFAIGLLGFLYFLLFFG